MLLRDVRDYIATLNIAEDGNCYCGKMEDKKDKSIGVYSLPRKSNTVIPIGGLNNASYRTKAISLLVHWNKSPTQAEQNAIALQEALLNTKNTKINEHLIKFIEVSYPEPVSMDTDDNGIFEYVIECLFYYER